MEEFWAEFTKKFTMAFVTGDRWKLYLKGMCTTLGLAACGENMIPELTRPPWVSVTPR